MKKWISIIYIVIAPLYGYVASFLQIELALNAAQTNSAGLLLGIVLPALLHVGFGFILFLKTRVLNTKTERKNSKITLLIASILQLVLLVLALIGFFSVYGAVGMISISLGLDAARLLQLCSRSYHENQDAS